MLTTPHVVRKDAVPDVSPTKSRSAGYKVGLALVLLIVAVTAIGVFCPSLGIGFLLDDFSHLDCSYAVGHGDFSLLAKAFSGNWTGTADNLTAYRPFISLSYCLDYLVWGLNPFGYHLSNLIMFAGCSVLTSLIAFELCAAFSTERAKLLVALASGAMFAIYPLHPEAVAWIIGRVDVQCGLFYFASLYFYLLFRRKESTRWLAASLAAFAFALPSKEMAVTVPVVIAIAEFLLPARELKWRDTDVKTRVAFIAPYCLMLLTFALIRTCALHTLVGGYGSGGLKASLQLFRNFLDKDTWIKIVYGANEEVLVSTVLGKTAFAALGGLGALLILRLGEARAYWRTLAFIALAAVVSEIPTFQIWHVFPNLCGSRLLFIPSAFLCMTLAMVALPAFNLAHRAGKTGAVSAVLRTAGAALLVVVGYVWISTLSNNLVPWTTAGNQMRTLTAQLHGMAGATGPGKIRVLLDLPQDHSGAGLLGRPEFMEELLRPPLGYAAETGKIVTTERPIPGSHDYAYPHQIKQITDDPSVQAVYKWDDKKGAYHNWRRPGGEAETVWTVNKKLPASDSAQYFWLPAGRFDPLEMQAVYVALENKDVSPLLAARMRLIWRSEIQTASWMDYNEGPFGQPVGNEVAFVPARYRTWLFNGAVKQIGFKIEPGTAMELTVVRGGSDRLSIPKISRDKGDGTRVRFDCSKVAGAKKALLIATASGVAFPDPAGAWMLPKSQLAATVPLGSTSGLAAVPAEVFGQAGVHQVAVLGVDGAGKPVGFLSEPLSIRVDAK